jgi:hypothetical protein
MSTVIKDTPIAVPTFMYSSNYVQTVVFWDVVQYSLIDKYR